MVKKLITSLDSSKGSGPDCITVVVLKNCQPELSYILAELFNVYASLVFQIVGRFHQWFLFFRMLGKGLLLKTTAPVSLLSVISKAVNNRIVDHLDKCGLFPDF